MDVTLDNAAPCSGSELKAESDGAGRDDDARLIYTDPELQSTLTSPSYKPPHTLPTPFTPVSNLYNSNKLQSRSLSDPELDNFLPGLRGPTSIHYRVSCNTTCDW
jgi:hypothetical protein